MSASGTQPRNLSAEEEIQVFFTQVEEAANVLIKEKSITLFIEAIKKISFPGCPLFHSAFSHREIVFINSLSTTISLTAEDLYDIKTLGYSAKLLCVPAGDQIKEVSVRRQAPTPMGHTHTKFDFKAADNTSFFAKTTKPHAYLEVKEQAVLNTAITCEAKLLNKARLDTLATLLRNSPPSTSDAGAAATPPSAHSPIKSPLMKDNLSMRFKVIC